VFKNRNCNSADLNLDLTEIHRCYTHPCSIDHFRVSRARQLPNDADSEQDVQSLLLYQVAEKPTIFEGNKIKKWKFNVQARLEARFMKVLAPISVRFCVIFGE